MKLQLSNMAKPVLTFVTGNKNKLSELISIVGEEFPYSITCKKIDLDEYQGDPEEISLKKCQLATTKCHGPLIVEDTCLCFNALNGLPGPYIKWFLDKIGNDGIVRMLHGFEDKSANAQCTLAYHTGKPGDDVKVFVGKVPGTIVSPRGKTTFGWDPIFCPDGFEKTFAELDVEEKNTVSHRRKAVELFKNYIISNFSGS